MASTDQQTLFHVAPYVGPVFQQMLEFQQQQLRSVMLWQQSLLAMQRDLYDQWSSVCAGGARLDD